MFLKQSIESLREKLQIKSEAINLLGKQLELCNKEKLEHKKLIDTLYDKNLSLKKSLYFKENRVDAEDENFFELKNQPSDMSSNTNPAKHKKNNTHLNLSNSTSPNISTASLFNDIDSDVCLNT